MNHEKKTQQKKMNHLITLHKGYRGKERDGLLLWKAFLDVVKRSVGLVIHLTCLVLTQRHSHSLYYLTQVSSRLGLFALLSTLPKLSCP